MKNLLRLSLSLGGLWLTLGCTKPTESSRVAWGDAGRGARLIQRSTCGTCHVIPGVHGAHGIVGPPLEGFTDRAYLAEQLPNSTRTLTRGLEPRIEPANAARAAPGDPLHVSRL